MALTIKRDQHFSAVPLSTLKPGALFCTGEGNTHVYVKAVFSTGMPPLTHNCIQCQNLHYCFCIALDTGTMYFFDTTLPVHEYDGVLTVHRAMKEAAI